MFLVEQDLYGKTVVRFKGLLDAAKAREVRAFLASDNPAGVTLDFSQAGLVDYYGLSALASELLSHSEVAVFLRGLGASQIGMLRYFGLDPAQFGLNEGPWGPPPDATVH